MRDRSKDEASMKLKRKDEQGTNRIPTVMIKCRGHQKVYLTLTYYQVEGRKVETKKRRTCNNKYTTYSKQANSPLLINCAMLPNCTRNIRRM
jgi:hypothetical protein